MFIPPCIEVPEEAFNYEPDAYLVFHGKDKKVQRFIFANQKFSDFENDKLHRLELEMQKQKVDPFLRHPEWTRADLLRFCYGSGWKTRVALKNLLNYLKWREAITPNGYMELLPKVEHMMVRNI